jgi:hypothetical protein
MVFVIYFNFSFMRKQFYIEILDARLLCLLFRYAAQL